MTGWVASRYVARPAQPGDARALFEWRNDDVARDASGSRDAIDWAAHCDWFTNVLADDDRHIYLVERNDVAIGMCRFDARQNSPAYEVSVNLAPAERGKAQAQPVLKAAIAQFTQEHGAAPLTARIRPANIPSVRLFTALGFSHVSSDEEFDFYELT